MAELILSLATDTGPVGAQIRTFLVGDDVGESVQSVRARIEGLKIPSEYEYRHAYGREMGAHLDFLVESIERLVLPTDPNAAFDLLVTIFEADAITMENCGEHGWAVACAYQRAADVMARTVSRLPSGAVDARLITLIAADAYGVRAALKNIPPESQP